MTHTHGIPSIEEQAMYRVAQECALCGQARFLVCNTPRACLRRTGHLLARPKFFSLPRDFPRFLVPDEIAGTAAGRIMRQFSFRSTI